MLRRLNLANGFTLLRVALTPFVIGAILEGRSGRAVVLFALAAFTDLLDGAAARWLRQTTASGAYLDPIADKCLLSGVFLALAAAHTVPWWFVIVVFGRDFYILMAAGLLDGLQAPAEISPERLGKAATFTQVAVATFWMAGEAFGAAWLVRIAGAALWVSALLTIWSGVHYTWRGIQVLRVH